MKQQVKEVNETNDSKITTRIVTTFGGNGSVGKTTTCCYLAHWYESLGLSAKLYDADSAKGSFQRFFPDKCETLDFKKFKQIDKIIDIAESGKNPIVLMDQRAHSDEMLEWFQDVPFDELREIGIAFTGLGCITSDSETFKLFHQWVKEIGDDIDYLLVKNEKDGDEFIGLDRTKEGIEFIKQYSPKIIRFPKIQEEFHAELDARKITMPQALDLFYKKDEEISGLNDRMMRGRFKRYLKSLYGEFNTAQDLLLP